jgi:CheY-like chemotaxis protein
VYAAGNEKVAHFTDRIMQAGFRARDLVKQILAFSRRTDQAHSPVQIAQVAKDAFKMLRASIPATVEMRLAIEDENVRVMASEIQLHQVFMNLCTNAAHAMAEKGGRLDLQVTAVSLSQVDCGVYPELKPGRYIRIMVSDTGTGIPRRIIERIFDPFFTTKPVGKGTGLGLSVVHGIVQSHGGALKVYSEEGLGTTFHILLPQYLHKAEAQAEVQDQGVALGSGKVLFVDDEEFIVDLGGEVLGSLGYTVVGVRSPEAALEEFRKDPRGYDLVITDYTMPGMTGIALCRELLQMRPEVPIIMCSGYAEAVSPEQASAAGVRAFVTKPLTRQQIGETVRSVLAQA